MKTKIPAKPLAPKLIRRSLGKIEIRATNEGNRQVDAIVCRYNVVDDYGSVWLPGCWSESLREKLPKIAFTHNWSDVIGRVVDFDDTDEYLALTLQFSDFEAVPQARRAWTQIRDGDIDEYSFGFERVERLELSPESEEWDEGIREKMVRARMYEVSPVLAGAVPGTQTLAVRGVPDGSTVDIQMATGIATRMAAGELDLPEALTELKRAAVAEATEQDQGTETGTDADTTGDSEGAEGNQGESEGATEGEGAETKDGANDGAQTQSGPDAALEQEMVLADLEAELAQAGY